jgi:hypothetical protein
MQDGHGVEIPLKSNQRKTAAAIHAAVATNSTTDDEWPR